MNKHAKILAFILLFPPPASFGQQVMDFASQVYKTDEMKSRLILFMAYNYCPDVPAILDYTKKPKQYTKWTDGTSYASQLISYSTVVHETCHGKNHAIGGFTDTLDQEGIFVSKDIQIRIPKTALYKTDELETVITEEQKEEIFRLRTYVLNQKDNGKKSVLPLNSVTHGIFGLLDEFTAYYHGTKASLEIYNYYKTVYADNPDKLIDVFSKNSSDVYAYYEFRLFIAWYLKYAKEKHPEVYESCLKNKQLREAFTLVDQAYEKTVKNYFSARQNLVDEINAQGKTKASINQYGAIRLENDGSKTRYSGPDKTILYLQSQFTAEDEAVLKEFVISGLTAENYGQ